MSLIGKIGNPNWGRTFNSVASRHFGIMYFSLSLDMDDRRYCENGALDVNCVGVCGEVMKLRNQA